MQFQTLGFWQSVAKFIIFEILKCFTGYRIYMKLDFTFTFYRIYMGPLIFRPPHFYVCPVIIINLC